MHARTIMQADRHARRCAEPMVYAQVSKAFEPVKPPPVRTMPSGEDSMMSWGTPTVARAPGLPEEARANLNRPLFPVRGTMCCCAGCCRPCACMSLAKQLGRAAAIAIWCGGTFLQAW